MEIILIFILVYYAIKHYGEKDKKKREEAYSNYDYKRNSNDYESPDEFEGLFNHAKYYSEPFETQENIWEDKDPSYKNNHLVASVNRNNDYEIEELKNRVDYLEKELLKIAKKNDQSLFNHRLNSGNLQEAVIVSEILARPKGSYQPYFRQKGDKAFGQR